MPAAVAIGLLGLAGTLSGRLESLLLVGGLGLVAVSIGWLVGPVARGSAGSDIAAVITFASLAAMVYLLFGTAMSLVAFQPVGGPRNALAVVGDAFGRLAYGLLYVPFWAGVIAPFAMAWLGALRWLRRDELADEPRGRPGPAEGDTTEGDARRARRLILISAAGIAVYGGFVAALPLLLYDEPRPPWWYERPVALAGLFATPAVIALAGLARGTRPIVIAAGVICLLQAAIAFSGVTLGFVVPGLVLVAMGASNSRASAWPTRPAVVAGGVVVMLTVAAWVALFALTAPRCWVGTVGPDGRRATIEVPATDQELHGPAVVPAGGSGCSSAEVTVDGMAVSAVLAFGAIAVANYLPSRPR